MIKVKEIYGSFGFVAKPKMSIKKKVRHICSRYEI